METTRSDKTNLSKRIAIFSLMALASLITISGAAFGVYSFVNNISFSLMNTEIPGFIFALVAVFLGVRYLLATAKFAKKLANESGSFSWSNFKNTKSRKARRRTK